MKRLIFGAGALAIFAGLADLFAPGALAAEKETHPAHKLPALPYAYDALEPYMDAQTMTIHHSKHHQGYVDKLNAALAKAGPELARMEIAVLMTKLSLVPEELAAAVRNNGGGHYNHSLFWRILTPKGGGEPGGELAKAIVRDFGSFAAFQQAFKAKALGQFGSGWAFLVLKPDGKLAVLSTPNQDNPLMFGGGTPILALDVWEHAYYLKYQNRRGDFVDSFWNVVNWREVERLYSKR